jgi:hypothetical protein
MRALESAVGALILLGFVVLIVLQRRRILKHEYDREPASGPEPQRDERD